MSSGIVSGLTKRSPVCSSTHKAHGHAKRNFFNGIEFLDESYHSIHKSPYGVRKNFLGAIIKKLIKPPQAILQKNSGKKKANH